MIDYGKEYIPCPLHDRYRLIDATGCRECYREREKASRPPKPVKLYRIPPQSDKKKARERDLAKLRKKKKQEQRYCESCGVSFGFSDYSHILSVKQFQQYELHPENAVIHCRTCHEIWEHGSLEEKMRLGNWQQMLNFILKYEPAYFNKLQLKSINKAA